MSSLYHLGGAGQDDRKLFFWAVLNAGLKNHGGLPP